jgi:SPP1 family predicted phage head-tail adaptor
MPVSGGGQLRSQIVFSERVSSLDLYGNEVADWIERFSTRAQFLPMKGGEDVLAARLEGRQPVVIRIRQSPEARAVTPDWKVQNVDNGVEFNIRGIIDPEEGTSQHGRWLDILAESGVATG